MDLHPDFRDLLAEFAREKVSYAVVGGYAVGHHAKPRATKDLDLLVSPSGDNLERVGRALEQFGAPTVSKTSMLHLPERSTRRSTISRYPSLRSMIS